MNLRTKITIATSLFLSLLTAQPKLQLDASYQDIKIGTFLGTSIFNSVLEEDDEFVYLFLVNAVGQTVNVLDKSSLEIVAVQEKIGEPFEEQNQKVLQYGSLNGRFAFIIRENFEDDENRTLLKIQYPNWGNPQDTAEDITLMDLKDFPSEDLEIEAHISNDKLLVELFKGENHNAGQQEIFLYDHALNQILHKEYPVSSKFNPGFAATWGSFTSMLKNVDKKVFDKWGNLYYLRGNDLHVYRIDQNYDRWIYRVPLPDLGDDYYVRNADFQICGDSLFLNAEIKKTYYQKDDYYRDKPYESAEGYVSQLISLETFDVLNRYLYLFSDDEKRSLKGVNADHSSQKSYFKKASDYFFQRRETIALEGGGYLRISEKTGAGFDGSYANYKIGQYGSIEITSFDSNGEYQWHREIQKFQADYLNVPSITRSFGYWARIFSFSSFQYRINGDSLVLFYNEVNKKLIEDEPSEGDVSDYVLFGKHWANAELLVKTIDLHTGDINSKAQSVELMPDFYLLNISNWRNFYGGKYLLLMKDNRSTLRFGYSALN